MDDDVQQQAERIDKDVALAPLTFLPASKPFGSIAAPFLRALTLWLSMIAAVGLASRASAWRHCDIKRVVDALQRAVPVPQVEIIVQRQRGGRSFAIARH